MPIPRKVTNDFFVPSINQLVFDIENEYTIVDYEYFDEPFFYLSRYLFDDDDDTNDNSNDDADVNYEYPHFIRTYHFIDCVPMSLDHIHYDLFRIRNESSPQKKKKPKIIYQTEKHEVLDISPFGYDYIEPKIV